MKNEITLKMVRYALVVGLFFTSMSCTDDMVDVTNVLNDEFVEGGVTNKVAAKKTKFDAPIVTLQEAAQASLILKVQAGETGMTEGFTIQWMLKSDFDIYGWNGTTLGMSPSYCHASASGNANSSRYNLNPWESTTIKIGDMLLDAGVSTSCNTWLSCGTTYVFRFFAHANKTLQRSDFSPTYQFTTLPCFVENICTYSQGWYKNHQSDWEYLVPNGLLLGNNLYSASQLTAILNLAPQGGNTVLIVAHQLIATKLNTLRGVVNTPAIDADILAADSWLASRDILTAYEKNDSMNFLAGRLDNFIQGVAGIGAPGHCQ